jgi:enoyl-[acyl-carrier protein] reductase/trans-2-enoyl-CoA reductase (NAD+)
MTRRGVHETTLQHKYRLFKDMVYGDARILDNEGRLRLDAPEMEPRIQEETLQLMKRYDNETIFNLPGTKMFIEEFYRIHGFHIINDDQTDVDMPQLAQLTLK